MADRTDAFEDGPSRPRRSNSSDGDSGRTASVAIDPAILAGNGDNSDPGSDGDNYVRDADGNVKRNRDGSPRKKRGRKAGGTNSKNGAQSPHDLAASIAMMTHGVVALHGLVAVMSQTPEMEVNQSEGEMLSKAIVPLMAHYHITPPPEMVLWGNLFVALAYVEGPRFALIRMRKATERAERARRVYDSPNAAPTGPAPGSEMPFGYGTGAAPGSGQPN